MKKKISKILGVGITLVMVLSLTAAFSVPVMASEEAWSLFDVPDESVAGTLGDAFMGNLVGGFTAFAEDIEGNFYIYVDGADPFEELLTSDDEGRTWSATDYGAEVTGDIVAIAVSSEDADVLYVATLTNVWKTEDAGDSWEDLGSPATSISAGTENITCLDLGYSDEEPHIFVGTKDSGAGTGEVWYYRDSPFYRVWTALDVCGPINTVAINTSDVWGIACSPDFDSDTLVVAVIENGGKSLVTANIGAGIGAEYWDDLELRDEGDTALVITEATNPVFVEDFDIDDDYELFVGVSGGVHTTSADGGVYRITGLTETDDFLLADVDDDIVSLDLVGDLGGISLVAGTTSTPASIWYSTDDGDSWDETDKAPTGVGATANYVLVAADFADSGEAWCASSAVTEGGFHITTDFGDTWNGISLLDTDMDGGVTDIAFTADYGTGDAPLFMVSAADTGAGLDVSVWKYDSTNWERVWLDAASLTNLVEVSPDYANDTAVFIAESVAPVISRSADGGADFSALVRQPDDSINAWLVIDDETIITADDDAGDIYKTTRYGRRAWDAITTGGGIITDLAMSPNYAADGALIAGDTASLVFISFDEGEEWDEVSGSDVADNTSSDNTTYVAFDTRYADNNLIYAASDDIVARVEIDIAEDMGDLEFDILSDGDLTSGIGPSGIVVSDDGTQAGEDVATLYVADAVADAGVWRCLNPEAGTADVVFEQAVAGLGAGEDFSPTVNDVRNLYLTYDSNILYAIDSAAAIPVVWTYEDTLAAPVVLSSPSDGAGLESTGTVEFAWEDLNADTVNVYQIQVNEEDDFPSATDETVGTCSQTGGALPTTGSDYHDDNELTWRDEADAGTTYYWRVRVGEGPADGGPLLSRWSVVGSFSMKVSAVTEPVAVRPLPGAQDIILAPSFGWEAVSGAETYEIEVATDAEFESLVTAGVPSINAWVIDVELDYATAYYWKVRGISATGAPEGDWIISAFTTMTEPEEAAAPVVVEQVTPATPEITVTIPTPETPAYVWAIIGIGALLVIALIILIVRTRRVV